MDESKQEAKAAKKAAKADVKTQKKLTKRTDVPPPSATDAPPSSADQSRTAAERSAAAAERQVRLQTYRVWIGVVVGLIALATLLVTLKFGKWGSAADIPPNNTSTTPREVSEKVSG